MLDPQTEETPEQRAYWDSLKGLKQEKAPNWRGDKIGKSAVHKWLDRVFGKPELCENKDCLFKSKTYDWCLKIGLEYERKRENFLRLCRSCHRRYDLTPEKREQAIANLKLFNPYYGKRRKLV